MKLLLLGVVVGVGVVMGAVYRRDQEKKGGRPTESSRRQGVSGESG